MSVQHLNESNFDAVTSTGVVLVDFWAEWCGPCRMLGPVLEEIATEIGDKAVIAKVNVEEAQNLAVKFNVQSIPAIFIMKDGEIKNQFIGVQDKQTLVKAIEDVL